MNDNNAIYFDSFGDAFKKSSKIHGRQKHNNKYLSNTSTWFMRGYFYIGFVDSMLKGQSLLDCTNLFSPYEYEKNDKIILKYFMYIS